MPSVRVIRSHAADRPGSRRSEPRSSRPCGAGLDAASLKLASLLLLWAVSAVGQPAPNASWKPPYEPQAVRERLAVVDSADVSRACGNLNQPWAYRGPAGRHMSLRSYGRRHAGPDWAQDFADRLTREATLDTVRGFRTTRVACEPTEGAPAYLVRLYSGGRSTFALLHFPEAMVLLFDAEEPLATIRMDDRADTLWAKLAARLDDDPLLRGPRPEPSTGDPPPASGNYVYVEELPEVLERAAPDYPESARFAGISGTVWVQALVGENGRVRDAVIVNGPTQLRDAALDAVWQWRFKPAFTNKEAIAVWVGIPVRFTLH